MLVLTRKCTEQVVIQVPGGGKGFEMVVEVLEIRGNKVRLGFDAPGEVRVDRREVLEERTKQGEVVHRTNKGG